MEQRAREADERRTRRAVSLIAALAVGLFVAVLVPTVRTFGWDWYLIGATVAFGVGLCIVLALFWRMLQGRSL